MSIKSLLTIIHVLTIMQFTNIELCADKKLTGSISSFQRYSLLNIQKILYLNATKGQKINFAGNVIKFLISLLQPLIGKNG